MQQAFVANAPRQTSHQDVVVDPVEKLFQVEVHDDLAPVGDVGLGLGERLMGAPPRAEAEARRRECRIENRLQDLQNRLLNQTVHHGRNAELACSTAGLGDFHPAHGFGLVAAVEQRGDQPVAVLALSQESSSAMDIASTPAAPLFALTRL